MRMYAISYFDDAKHAPAIIIGSWLIAKLQRQQRQSGTYQAARNAYRQGIPIKCTLAALCNRSL